MTTLPSDPVAAAFLEIRLYLGGDRFVVNLLSRLDSISVYRVGSFKRGAMPYFLVTSLSDRTRLDAYYYSGTSSSAFDVATFGRLLGTY